MITLKTLGEATEQEVFDQVVNHMLTQNERSISTKGDICRYRSFRKNKTLKCAAGCLMSDEEYNRNFENKNWSDLMHAKIVPRDHYYLINRLQNIHDGSDVEDWERLFRDHAQNNGLKFNYK